LLHGRRSRRAAVAVSSLGVVLGLMLAWNRTHCCPPLPDDVVVQVVQGIARVHERGASETP